jgi:hypothetical protein
MGASACVSTAEDGQHDQFAYLSSKRTLKERSIPPPTRKTYRPGRFLISKGLRV